MSDVNPCIHCGHAVHGAAKYCPECGQPAVAPRIDWHFLARELEHGVFNMDRGLLFTVGMLLFRPGRLIRDYIAGRRAGHVKPLWLVMVTAALVVFLTRYVPGAESAVEQFGDGYRAGVQADGNVDAQSMAMIAAFQSVAGWVGRHLAAATLILLPLEAALLKLAFWRVRGLNYPEWLTITAFLTAQTFLIWSFFVLLRWWLPRTEEWMLWATFGYAIFSLVLAFDDHPRWKIALRGLAGFGMYFIANGLIIAAISVAAALLAR